MTAIWTKFLLSHNKRGTKAFADEGWWGVLSWGALVMFSLSVDGNVVLTLTYAFMSGLSFGRVVFGRPENTSAIEEV